ncbi:transporter substrate-binding protein [Kovacikia minuta CCNUW1]|uniref:transporter substrate-binding protein n=1 Tax=Kovacikia minuta TaxID=2931930 RepID=UPI001CCD25CB|nr:transporter substrate-binding protein [Kovacikia minuta]UBF28374.1 transporter substrate-binding protein [Kovacikia minuta CCNUW1]
MRVGILHSLSGVMATNEIPLKDAELLAIDEINQTGGVLGELLEPEIEDGASDPVEFERKARKLIQKDQVATIFGCWTSDSRKAVLPVFEECNSLLWYPVRYEGLESSRNIFYTGSCPNQQVEPAITWLLQNQRPRIFLVGSNHAFARTVNKIVKAQLKQQGGVVVGETYVPLGHQDFAAAIAEIQQFKPDAIFSTIKGSSNRHFYSQYQEAGCRADEIPVLAVSLTELELSEIGVAAVGHYLSWSYFQNLNTCRNQTFVQNFHRRYGSHRVISDPVEAAYTQVYLWKQSVETAQSLESDRVRVAAYGQTFEAPNGWISIEPNHHVCKPCRIGQVLPTGKIEIVFASNAPIKPLPWLGVEAASSQATAIAIEMLSEVAQDIQYSCQLEQKSRELEAALAQIQRDVIERKRAEEALRQSEATNRALISAIPDLLIRVSGNGTYLGFVSGGKVKLFNPAKFSIGSSVFDSLAPEAAHQRMHYIRRALQTGEMQIYEHSLVIDGVQQDEEIRIAVLGDDEVMLMVRDITDRKRTEAALRQSEATNRALIAAIPDLLIRAHGDGTYLDITGRDRLNIQNDAVFSVGSHVYDSLPPDLAALRMHHIRKALETGEMQLYEQQFVMAGRTLFEEVRVVVSGDNEVLAIVRDITDRKQAEEALRQSEARFRAVFENAAISICITHLDGTYLESNPATRAMFGYSEAELSQKTFAELTYPDDLKADLALYSDLLDGRRDFYQIEKRYIRKDGQIVWGKLAVCAVRDETGVFQFTFGMVEDITDRKRAETALRQSEVKNRALLSAIPDMMFYYSREGVHLDFLPAKQFQPVVPPHEFLGKPVTDVLPVPIAEQIVQTIGQALETGQTQFIEYQLPVDGEIHDYEARIVACEENRALAIVREISDRKRAEAALQNQFQRALLLKQIIEELRQSLDSQQIFQTTAHLVGQTFQTNRCLIHSYVTQPFPHVPLTAEYWEPGYESLVTLEVPVIGNPHMQQVLVQDAALVSDNVYTDPLLHHALDLCQQINLKSMMAIRTSYQGETNGVIGLHQCDRYRQWTEDEIELFESVAAQVGIALAQAQLAAARKTTTG